MSGNVPSETGSLTAMNDRGILQVALDLKCPDVGLKESTLQEFLVIDDHYLSLLDQLEQLNKEVLR